MSNVALVLRRLAERLRAADFTADGLRRLLGITFPDDIGLLNHAPMLERLRGDRSALAVLARLFCLEVSEPAASLRQAIPLAEQTALARLGLLTCRGGMVSARLRIDALDDLCLLADRRFRRPDGRALRLPAGDMVYPASSDSAILAGVVVTREGDRVLDLCSGTGVQGLAVARRVQGVVAGDIGARAVSLARLNAEFNGVSNFEVRQGDLFRPFAGQRYELILANPPFVPSPQRGPAYHSGGALGDRVLRRMLCGITHHLQPGGRAFAISYLALRSGEDLASRLRPWVKRFPGRVLALVLETASPVDLAAAQALFALDKGLAAYAAEVQRWVHFLRRRAVERVVLIMLVAEKRGRHCLDVIEAYQRTLSLPLSKPAQDHVATWLGIEESKGKRE